LKALRSLLFSLMVGASAVVTTADARAEDPPKQEELPRRKVNFAWDKTEKSGTLLRASFSFRDVIDKTMSEKLASGLPTVIAMRAYVLREGDANPVALAVRTCRVVYDLWDEVYRLKISGPGGERDTAALNLDGVLRQCAEARDLPVAERSLLTAGKPHFLGVIVEVNPVSPQMLEQMRKWVSRPAGSTGIGPTDALFGSFVGLFVKQMGTADRTLRFRSTDTVTP
jgi:hypothetical protein